MQLLRKRQQASCTLKLRTGQQPRKAERLRRWDSSPASSKGARGWGSGPARSKDSGKCGSSPARQKFSGGWGRVPTRRIREWAIIGWETEEWQTKGGRRQAVPEDHAEVDARHAGASEADCGLQGWTPRRWSRSGEIGLRPSEVGRMESWDGTHRFWRLGDFSSPLPQVRCRRTWRCQRHVHGMTTIWSCRQSTGWQVLRNPHLNFIRRNGAGLRGELRDCFWALFQSHWGRRW